MAATTLDGLDPTPLSATEALMWHAEATRRVFHPWFGAHVLLVGDPDTAAFVAALAAAADRLPRLGHSVATKGFGVGLPSWRVDKVDPR